MQYAFINCPVTQLVCLFHTQWAFPLLVELQQSPATFSQLKRALIPITNKTLAHCLRQACTTGCISKQTNMYTINIQGQKLLSALTQAIPKTPECMTCRGKNICL